MNALLNSVLRALILAYRYALSPWLGAHCRFHPSCSAFALEALEVHGPWRGSALALGRLLRCHPWQPGGYDPVPRAENAPARHQPTSLCGGACSHNGSHHGPYAGPHAHD